jgi:cell division protein FtsI/penicillin-binding protein 2
MSGLHLPTPTARTRLRCTAATVALVAVTSACGLLDRTPDPNPAVHRFVENLRNRSVDPATLVHADDAAPAERLLADVSEELGTPPQFPLAGPVEMGPVPGEAQDGDVPQATARLRLRWRLASGTWAYDTRLPLRFVDGRWKVSWNPAVLHPLLRDGHTLQVRWTTPKRGPILSADGQPLFTPHPVVTVYVQPRRVRDLDHVLAVLTDTVGIEPAPLRRRVEAADPDHLVEVITLRVEDYAPLRTTLHPVPGLVFDLGRRPLTPTRAFARAVLGRVGPPTAEVLDEMGPGFAANDMLGLSGLQRQFQRHLAGQPGLRVLTVDARGEVLATLHEMAPTPGKALRTTLEPRVQTAADAAVSTVDDTAALVALRASSGEVLAVANGPDGGDVDVALAGRYPPAATFTVVTTAALVSTGLDAATPVRCPATVTVGGRTFRNADGTAIGPVPFRAAFAQACDTTFVELAGRLPDGALTRAGRQFGFEGRWSPGINAFTGKVPAATDDAERAASAVGQGRVLASPLLMASVAAAAADGTWRPPVLLPDHAHPGAGPRPLEPRMSAVLSDVMRDVVRRGTGTALGNVPGPPVHAATGAAEDPRSGSAPPPAWVVAYRGDVAIAVLIEDASRDSHDAVAVAAEFFRRLGG